MSMEDMQPSTPQINRDDRIRRMRYRSWHRGCKETDIILGNFCDHHIDGLDDQALDIFEALLDEDDDHIWRWLTHKENSPKAEYEPLLEQLRGFREYAPL